MSKTYAMICNNRVIEVLHNQDMPPVFPPDLSGNVVTAIECPECATREWAYDHITGEVFQPIYEEIVFEEVEISDPSPTQLDRIEAAVTASKEQIAQEARDAYTLELIEGGVIA